MRNFIIIEDMQDKNSPINYSFEAINEYVHSFDIQYEDLECLCLEMARHIDSLNNKIEELNTKLDFESNRANTSQSELYRLVGKLVECGRAKIETVNIEIGKK